MAMNPILYLPLTNLDNGQTREATGRRCIVKGAPVTVEDTTFGRVFDFPGTAEDYVIIRPAGFFPKTAVTLSCWIKASDVKKTEATILSYNVDTTNHFTLLNFKRLSLFLNNVKNVSKTRVNDGVWCHLAVTWQSEDGLLRRFKDGREIYRRNSGTGVTLRAGGALVLGQDGPGSDHRTVRGRDIREYDKIRLEITKDTEEDHENSQTNGTRGTVGYSDQGSS